MVRNENRGRIPHIDPSVKHVGASALRTLTSGKLKELAETLVIQDNDKPLAVLLTYETYMAMQAQLNHVSDQLYATLNTLEVLSDREELQGLQTGLQQLEEGKGTSLDAIRASLRKNR